MRQRENTIKSKGQNESYSTVNGENETQSDGMRQRGNTKKIRDRMKIYEGNKTESDGMRQIETELNRLSWNEIKRYGI